MGAGGELRWFVNGSHAFLPLLIKQDSGTLVNVSSIFGLHGFPFQSAYSASKHAVRGFTESLRHEMRGTGVNIAVVDPAASRPTSWKCPLPPG